MKGKQNEKNENDNDSEGELDNTPPRFNGFQRPYSIEQLISWIFWTYFNISFYILMLYPTITFDTIISIINLLLSFAVIKKAYEATSMLFYIFYIFLINIYI